MAENGEKSQLSLLVTQADEEIDKSIKSLDAKQRGLVDAINGLHSKWNLTISSAVPRLKIMSLVFLSIQNSVLILFMRYVRTRSGEMFRASSAVVVSEIIKLMISLVGMLAEEGSVKGLLENLKVNIIHQPTDCLKITIPALFYVFQNNLLYVAVSNLDVATFQVTYQIKILTTALFSVIILKKRLSRLQWLALMFLFTGVSVVQVNLNQIHHIENNTSAVEESSDAQRIDQQETHYENKFMKQQPGEFYDYYDDASEQAGTVTDIMPPDPDPDQSQMIGVAAVLLSSTMSGFACVYFEMLLKGTQQGIWLRNVELASLGIVFGAVMIFIVDKDTVTEKDLLYGFDAYVWFVVTLEAIGGLLVALAVKYSDNILKCFATSAAIIASSVLSVFIFGFLMTETYVVGAALVIMSIIMYARFPAQTNA